MTTITTDRLAELRSLADEAAACRRCEIGSTRQNAVFSDGNPFARVMIVGEGPGENEDATGVPFVGPAGMLLDRMLAAIGLDRKKDVYIANVIKCRASIVENNRVKNRPPRKDEAQNCSDYLLAQIKLVDPEIIIAAGAPAAKALLGDPNFAITRGRGRWYAGPYGIATMVTFHPAHLLHLKEEAEPAKRLVWGDLKEVRSRLDGASPRPAAATEPPRTQNPEPPPNDAKQISLF